MQHTHAVTRARTGVNSSFVQIVVGTFVVAVVPVAFVVLVVPAFVGVGVGEGVAAGVAAVLAEKAVVHICVCGGFFFLFVCVGGWVCGCGYFCVDPTASRPSWDLVT